MTKIVTICSVRCLQNYFPMQNSIRLIRAVARERERSNIYPIQREMEMFEVFRILMCNSPFRLFQSEMKFKFLLIHWQELSDLLIVIIASLVVYN